jgi:plastocyanin
MSLNRQRPLAVLAIVMSIALAACSSTSSPTPTVAGATGGGNGAAPNMIKISNFAFSPDTMTVKVGSKVTWTNEDSATHTVVSDDGKTFQSRGIAQNATYSFTFTSAGTFPYHCSVHPQMTAKIIVTP